MATTIFRGDAPPVPQVTTLTPGVANSSTYIAEINGKQVSVDSDASALAQEIVEAAQTALEASTLPEFAEITWTENNSIVTGTGPDTGRPFTLTDGGGSGTWTPSTTTAGDGPSHWKAANFSAGLPANSDTVILSGNSTSVLYSLDQNAVTLALLDIRADYEGEIGLPEINVDDASNTYYEYRDTHLKISATALRIGSGSGFGSRRIKLNLGSNACDATVFSTSSNPADQDEAAVHLVGSHGSNALQVLGGSVDLSMLPGFAGQWSSIVASGGAVVRCGYDVTLGTVEASGNAQIETRKAVTTLKTTDQGRVVHFAGNITTATVSGGSLTIQAGAALTITTLNAYAGRSLDLSGCDAAVTITDMNIYATPENPFTIIDPGNRLVMTNPAACPNGAGSLIVRTGPARTVKVA
jgi:hypothetical protein